MHDENQKSASCGEDTVVPDKSDDDPSWEVDTRDTDVPRAEDGISDMELQIWVDIHDSGRIVQSHRLQMRGQ